VLDFCPTGFEECPIPGMAGDFECLETLSELNSCGGCASTGAGVDCTKIAHVDDSTCYGGSCTGT